MRSSRSSTYGVIGRLGRWTATHFRLVALVWVLIAVGLGVVAPRVEQALSGAAWEATGSESVQVRATVDREFGGLSSSALMVVAHSKDKTAADPAFRATVAKAERTLAADARVTGVVSPQPRQSISRDGHTAVIQAGAGAGSNEMVRAADDLKKQLHALQGDGVQVSLTGASGMWSDFNEANKTAMMKSELLSWPVAMGILVLAFGSLVAAGLPLLLTILGLVASAGTLYLGTQLLDISIWAMNFALMFALALGIDYALFVVYRFRGALFGSEKPVEDAVAETMDTAGKAVLFSGLTVLISLTAVMLVPSPASRSMALGIMLSVVFILAVASRADAARAAAVAAADPGVARVLQPVPGSNGDVLAQVIPVNDPSNRAVGDPIERLRDRLPANALVGGAVAENHDLEQALAGRTPLVIGIVLALGFLLLLVALQAPVLAGVGVLTNLLAVGAAFGVARLIFQEGHLAGLLGLEPQGFLDAWAPVFFFAMVFAISMDYTVFLLSSAKEHWDRSHDPKVAMVGGLAHSGRVIFAAAAVMVARVLPNVRFGHA